MNDEIDSLEKAPFPDFGSEDLAPEAMDAAEDLTPEPMDRADDEDALRHSGPDELDPHGASLEEDDPPLALPDGPLLSREESAALLDAIRSGAVETHAARSLELGSVDEPMRRAQRRMDDLASSAVATLRDGLLRGGMTPQTIESEPSLVTPLEAFQSRIADTAAVWTLRAGADVVGRVALGPLLAQTLLERRLGAADGVVATRPMERAPSGLELRVLEPLARAISEVLVAPFVPGALTLSAPGRASELGSPLAPCLSVSFLVTPKGGAATEVLVALLAPALGRVATVTGRTMPRVIDALGDVEVDLVAVLGRCPFTVRSLLALDCGSVLRLDGAPETPVELQVDGVPVLRGMPVVKDGNLAIEVKT